MYPNNQNKLTLQYGPKIIGDTLCNDRSFV